MRIPVHINFDLVLQGIHIFPWNIAIAAILGLLSLASYTAWRDTMYNHGFFGFKLIDFGKPGKWKVLMVTFLVLALATFVLLW